MCSNTSTLSSSGGGGGDNDRGGGGGGGGSYGGGDSIYSKKQIRSSQQKVPKRGPGVAELEKILREQENNNKNTTTTTNLVSPLMSSSSSNYRSLQSSNSNLLPVTSVSLSPSPSPSPNPNILKHFNGGRMWNNSNCELELNGASRFQFSALPLTGQLFHPSSPSSSSNNNLMQTATQHSGPPTKNLFPHSGLGSSSSSLTTLSGGTCSTHGREPPSNQTSYRHSSTLRPEEDKMVGEKRARAFAMEMPPVPPFRYHLPTLSAQMNSRLETPFSCDTRTLFNLEPPDHTISREMRQTTCLEPNNKKAHTEHGESERNFLIYPSPTIPPSLIHTPNIFNPFSFQESNGDLQHNLAFSTHHHHHHNQGGSSITKKPFYTFLPPRDKLGIAEGLNTERVETRGDTIDLDLRL